MATRALGCRLRATLLLLCLFREWPRKRKYTRAFVTRRCFPVREAVAWIFFVLVLLGWAGRLTHLPDGDPAFG